MTTTKQYDLLNRLTNISSINSQPSTINSFRYAYNSANQSTSVTNADASHWVYGYDSLGQVTGGKKYWSDGTNVAGQQFELSCRRILADCRPGTRVTRPSKIFDGFFVVWFFVFGV
jgi:YD repeat-containing protein